MSKIGLIVDGPGDFAALKSRFGHGYKILKTDGPRGHTVSIEQIVTRSRKQIAILKSYQCDHVVIVTDFEERQNDYGSFRRQLSTALSKVDAGIELFCAVPNRMIENWYLADIAYLSTQKVFLRPNIQQRSFEGANGKQELKKLFVAKYSYDEVDHGCQLFSIVRLGEARGNSESLDHFLSLLVSCQATIPP